MLKSNIFHPAPTSQLPLHEEEKALARAALRRFAVERLSDEELVAEYHTLEEEWVLYRADLAAGDFRDYPRAVLESAIAYFEAQLQAVKGQMERRVRAAVHRADASEGRDFQERFDAMRLVPLADALVQEPFRLPLRKMGNSYRCPCPLHGGEGLNFSIHVRANFWHCFVCHEGGDLVSFVAKTRYVSRVEALDFLEGFVRV